MSDQSPLDLEFTTLSFIYTRTLDGQVEVKVTRHDLTNSKLLLLLQWLLLGLHFTSCFTYLSPNYCSTIDEHLRTDDLHHLMCCSGFSVLDTAHTHVRN